MSAPIPQQVTPLLGWELGTQESSPGKSVVVVNCHTVVGPLRFYVMTEDLRRWCADMLNIADEAEKPQLLRPITGLLGPNGMPMMPGTASNPPLGPPAEQLPDEDHQGTLHPNGGYIDEPADLTTPDDGKDEA